MVKKFENDSKELPKIVEKSDKVAFRSNGFSDGEIFFYKKYVVKKAHNLRRRAVIDRKNREKFYSEEGDGQQRTS